MCSLPHALLHPAQEHRKNYCLHNRLFNLLFKEILNVRIGLRQLDPLMFRISKKVPGPLLLWLLGLSASFWLDAKIMLICMWLSLGFLQLAKVLLIALLVITKETAVYF
jgi:hypothetical protein